MVIETGTPDEFKTCLLENTSGWPSIGYCYSVPNYDQNILVFGVDPQWVHIVTMNLYTATSYATELWLFHVEQGSIKRLDTPWVDTSDLRQSLLGI